MELMKSALEIIEETVEYYGFDTSRRATGKDESCFYLSDDNKMCAVGRCLSNPGFIEHVSEQLGGSISSTQLFRDIPNFNEYFKSEYQGHSNEFWDSLQMIHDFDSNWDSKGLTDLGKKRIKELKLQYKDM